MIPTKPPILDSDLWGKSMPPAVRLLKARYMRLGLDRWTNKRIIAVMKAYKITLREMCAFAGVFSKVHISRYWEANKWPMSIALHFAILETLWAEKQGLKTELIRDEACLTALLENVTKQQNNA